VEHYIRITQKKVTTRIVLASRTRCQELLWRFASKAESAGLDVDPTVHSTQGALFRSKSEERAAVKLLNLVL
jgi:hypothetical protein